MTDNSLTPAERASQVPVPKTYHLLCMLPEVKDTYDSGIIKADVAQRNEQILSMVLCVMAVGPDAYKDEKRFPSGPSCKVGDFILVEHNTGTRVKIHGREFRIIDDDHVLAVVDDPRGISRV